MDFIALTLDCVAALKSFGLGNRCTRQV